MTLWDGIDRLIEGASPVALRAHHVHLLALRRWREIGRKPPDSFVRDLHESAAAELAVPVLLRRIRDAVDGPLIVFKGPEVAARYPDPTLRPYQDLDLLVPSAEAVQAALRAAGFRQIEGDDAHYASRHHLRPLYLEEYPLLVEVHRRPEWPHRIRPPAVDELFESAVPAAVAIEGVLTFPAAQHTAIVAAHSWSTLPLRRLLDLVDVAALAQDVERAELLAFARRWKVERIVGRMLATSDALFLGRRVPSTVRIFASDLIRVRDTTVLERHLRRIADPFWALPVSAAIAAVPATVVGEFRPLANESWRTKLRRSGLAVRNAFRGGSEYDRLRRADNGERDAD